MSKQVQVTAPGRKVRIGPKNITQEVPEAVKLAMAQVEKEAAEKILFEQQDVEQALKIYDIAMNDGDRRRGILEVMLFALKVAAINLNVR